MIYTVTMNPSLDYVLDTEDFSKGNVNRAKSERIFVGGKGINVSAVLKNLGAQSVALGFTAGFTGKEIEREITERGIKSDFIRLKVGLSRINVKIRSKKSGLIFDETELNGAGPKISENDFSALLKKISILTHNDFLVLSGSVPKGIGSDSYKRILHEVFQKTVRVAVDASGSLFEKSLEEKPFLVKPNAEELGAIFGVKIKTKREAAVFAKKIQEKGAKNVLVSLSKDGAVLACENGSIYCASAPKIELKNSVGAGDSMLAGFIFALEKSESFSDALRLGICAGSASAASENLATKERVFALKERVFVKEM